MVSKTMNGEKLGASRSLSIMEMELYCYMLIDRSSYLA